MSNYTAITPKGTVKIWEDDPANSQTNRFENQREAERHYDSIVLREYQLSQRLGRYQAQFGDIDSGAPSPSEGVEQHFTTRMIWKPDGNTKTPVFVMDKRYTQGGVDGGDTLIVGDVTVFAANGQKIENLRYGSSGNGGRGNWRSSKKVEQLMPHAPLTIRWTFQGQEEYIIVRNPSKRYSPHETSVE